MYQPKHYDVYSFTRSGIRDYQREVGEDFHSALKRGGGRDLLEYTDAKLIGETDDRNEAIDMMNRCKVCDEVWIKDNETHKWFNE